MNVPFRDRKRKVTTALVPIAPTAQDRSPTAAGSRPNADFIAQLIATSAQAPQTRARRRAEPGEAIAAYDAVGQWPIRSGRRLSRSF
jgi:hypothetical protein